MTYEEIKYESNNQSATDGSVILLMIGIGGVTLSAAIASYLF